MLVSPDKLNNLCIYTDRNYSRCYVNKQINVNLLSINIKLPYISFDLLTDRLTPSVTDQLLIMYDILLRQLFFVAVVVWVIGFFIWLM